MQRQIKFRNYLSIAVLAASITFFLIYFLNNKEQFEPLLHIEPLYIILLIGATAGSLLLNGIFIKIILQPFNKKIGVKESFYVSVISSMGNYFAPVGTGLGFRAIYLKRRHNLSYGDFLATISGNYILVFLTTSLTGLISLSLLHSYTGYRYWILFGIFGLLFIFTLALTSIKFAKNMTKAIGRIRKAIFIVRILSKIIEGWLLIITNRRILWQLLGLTAVGLPLSVATSYLILQALNMHISFGGVLLLVALSYLSVFINITPGNLGVKEAIYIFSSQAIGLSTPQILSYALVERGILFFVLLGVWTFLHINKGLTENIYNLKR